MASLYLLEDATYFALQTNSTGYTTAKQKRVAFATLFLLSV